MTGGPRRPIGASTHLVCLNVFISLPASSVNPHIQHTFSLSVASLPACPPSTTTTATDKHIDTFHVSLISGSYSYHHVVITVVITITIDNTITTM